MLSVRATVAGHRRIGPLSADGSDGATACCDGKESDEEREASVAMHDGPRSHEACRHRAQSSYRTIPLQSPGRRQ